MAVYGAGAFLLTIPTDVTMRIANMGIEMLSTTMTALEDEGVEIINKAATTYVPQEDIDLMYSGHLSAPTLQSDYISIDVIFGGLSQTGRNVDYAAAVDADETKMHPKGGGPHYLYNAAMDELSNMSTHIQQVIHQQLISETEQAMDQAIQQSGLQQTVSSLVPSGIGVG